MDARVQKMVELVEWYCASANLGYDQWNRWDFPAPGDATTPGECDCSSLVYHCAELAGFNVPKSGTRYTGTMLRDFQNAGFKWVQTSSTNWEPGDILYKDGHTAIWTGKYIAEAYGDEHNGAHGGATGDQGNETRLSPKRGGWLGYFRFPEPKPVIVWPAKDVEPVPAGEAFDYIIEEGSNDVMHEMEQNIYSYRWSKWASGKLEVWVSDYFNGSDGNAYKGEYFLNKTLECPHTHDQNAPAFIDPPSVMIQARAARGWVSLQISSLTSDNVGLYAFGTDSSIPRFYIDAYMVGTWK